MPTMQGRMAMMQDGMQQLAGNTSKLENKLIDNLAALQDNVKGLREEMECKTRCLREELAEEVKLRKELKRVRVVNAAGFSVIATMASVVKSEGKKNGKPCWCDSSCHYEDTYVQWKGLLVQLSQAVAIINR